MTTFRGPAPDTEDGIGALTLGGLLEDACARYAGRDAIAFCPPDAEPVRWSYDELWRQARAVARALLAVGVVKGTRVGLLLPNRPEWVASAFGTALAGGVVVPFSSWAHDEELDHLLRHSDVALLITESRFQTVFTDQVRALCPELADAVPGQLRSARYPFLRRIVDVTADRTSAGVQSWAEFLREGDVVPDRLLAVATEQVTPADDAIVIYTSGTTALPKGVLHAHRGPALQVWRFASRQRLVETDRILSSFPFCWTAGIAMVLGATLAAGGCLVVQEMFSAGEVLRLIDAEAVTDVRLWPHQAAQVRDHPDRHRYRLTSLRRDRDRLDRRADGESGIQSSSAAGYGMSETFTIVTSAPVDAPPDVVFGSHGYVLPGNAVRILDPGTGALLGPGQEGEIAVKGRTLMRGYVKLPPEACFDDDGFFHSGDIGFVDEQGLLHWTGRSADLIKTGGANVSPVELETLLSRHPGVQAAAAVGLPDPLLGEVTVACVIRVPGADVGAEEIRRFVRERAAAYKVPRHVLFFTEDELPLTASHKIQPGELRALASARLGSAAIVSG